MGWGKFIDTAGLFGAYGENDFGIHLLCMYRLMIDLCEKRYVKSKRQIFLRLAKNLL